MVRKAAKRYVVGTGTYKVYGSTRSGVKRTELSAGRKAPPHVFLGGIKRYSTKTSPR